jgi:hypothetical protein
MREILFGTELLGNLVGAKCEGKRDRPTGKAQKLGPSGRQRPGDFDAVRFQRGWRTTATGREAQQRNPNVRLSGVSLMLRGSDADTSEFCASMTVSAGRGYEKNGGRGGIRTRGTFYSSFDFESSALNRTQPPFR